MVDVKISVIMPAYNAAKRICQSVRTIEEQTYKNFELIIINDGSNDETEEICKELSVQYGNIVLLSQKNAGPGKARETGIGVASGELVAFVDADDYLDTRAFEIVVRIFREQNFDILQFGYTKVDDKGKKISTNILPHIDCKTRIESFGYFITQKISTNFLWDKIYKRRLFYSIDWPCIFYSEDYVVLSQLYGEAEKTITIDDSLYYYVQHDESAVNKPFSERKLGQITAGRWVIDYTRKLYPQYVPEALSYLTTRSARLAKEAYYSNLPQKKEIYEGLKNEFDCSYREMIFELKKQNRTMKLDKMTRLFAISPLIAVHLKK